MPQYTVQKGDTLSSIAAKTLGSAARYRELGYSGDPTKLAVGTVLNYGAPAQAPAVGSNPAAAPGTPGGLDPALAGVGNQVANRPDAPVINPQGIADLNQARDFINSDQASIIEEASAPPVRTSSVQNIQDRQKEIEATIATATGAAPEKPALEQSFANLRTQYGLGDLENSLTELQNQEAMLNEKLKADIEAERLKTGVAQGVIEGRIGELDREARLKLSELGTKMTNVTNQLRVKYDVVNSLMKFKQLDYGAATDDYKRKYDAAIQSFNVAKGIEEEAKDEAERAKDDARANLQIVANAIKDAAIGELSPDQKVLINKLEMQAGMPVGITEQFKAKNPKADILTSSNWTDPSGKEYVTFVSRSPDGQLKTEQVFIGQGKPAGSGGSGGGTVGEREDAKAKMVAAQLNGRAGEDGYISPEDYRLARRVWVNEGLNAKDFDERFASTYANPNHLEDYAINSSVSL